MVLKPNAPRIQVSFTVHATRFQYELVTRRITENVRGLLFGPNITGGEDLKSGTARMNVAFYLDGSITRAVDKNDILRWLHDVEKTRVDDLEILKIYPDGQSETVYK